MRYPAAVFEPRMSSTRTRVVAVMTLAIMAATRDKSIPLRSPPGMALAPSGRRAAVWRFDDAGNQDIWEVDLTTGILSRPPLTRLSTAMQCGRPMTDAWRSPRFGRAAGPCT